MLDSNRIVGYAAKIVWEVIAIPIHIIANLAPFDEAQCSAGIESMLVIKLPETAADLRGSLAPFIWVGQSSYK